MEPSAFQERRTTARHRVFKGGQILGRGQSVSCIVRNLSPHGAGIEIDGAAPPLPPSLTIVIGSERVIRRAHLRWRNAGRIGVEFD